MSPLMLLVLFLYMTDAKFYRPFQFHPYKTGFNPNYNQQKPTSRHKNHCAYVTEKTVSFTMQDGAAPYVKAEYNKCSWGHKCPSLLYRLMYKPVYKVAHRTVTELEWRCCPGFSGYDCMEGHPMYQHSMRMMPPFREPTMKGLQFQGTQQKGPMSKSPVYKGLPINAGVQAHPWSQPKGPPTSSFNSYPMSHFGGPNAHSHASFESDPSEAESVPEDHEPDILETNQEHEHELHQGPEELIPEEIPAPPSGEDQPEEEVTGQVLDNETKERIHRIEEDVQRLNQGLETLRGIVTGLEDSLRASLREDANRMLSALLSAGPGPIPAPAISSNPSTIGFAEIPGGHPDREGLDGSHIFSGLPDLNGRVEEVRTELQQHTAELRELKTTVMGHDRIVRKISNGAAVLSDFSGNLGQPVEDFMESKLSEYKADILDGLKKHTGGAQSPCEEKTGDEGRQCQKEWRELQETIRPAVEESAAKLRSELGSLQAQIHGFTSTGSCCEDMYELVERVQRLDTSVARLNQTQGRLRVELGSHRDHIEGILEGRLGYVEAKLNLTGKLKSDESDKMMQQDLEIRMEGKLRAVEGRLQAALEELGNATALLEGHALPPLETEVESLRARLELDVDRVQKQLNGLEILCSSTCSSLQTSGTQGDSAGPDEVQVEEQSVKEVLHMQGERLNSLNTTLQEILTMLTARDQQVQQIKETPIQAELTFLKFNVYRVNRSLTGLHDSLGTVAHQMGQVNSSWHERELRLAHQIKGVVQLVGHQASMLGAGERKLTRLKGELQDVKRRLAEEVRACRSTATVVKKEVSEVGGRVASVEDQCRGLNNMAEDLERIRDELERQSSGLLLQVNGTLSSHAQQLSELKGELKNCTSNAKPANASQMTADVNRGDTFTMN
uniref:Elastin microfibril interfacer 3a n=1 Tax=Oryzias sinensis TaxID=183150 RepID=A0A8C8DYD3_9TELE